jgi:hypothetical protein
LSNICRAIALAFVAVEVNSASTTDPLATSAYRIAIGDLIKDFEKKFPFELIDRVERNRSEK